MTDADQVAEAVKIAFAGGYAHDPRFVSQDIDVARVHVIDIARLDKLPEWSNAAPTAKAIKVYVATMAEKVTSLSRGTCTVEYVVHVAIAAKPRTTGTDDIDPLKQVTQELRDWFYFLDRALPGRQEAIEGDVEILFDPHFDALRSTGQFLSEFVLTFTGSRTR